MTSKQRFVWLLGLAFGLYPFQVFAAWIQDGGELNLVASYSAGKSCVAFDGVTPYVVWVENDNPQTTYFLTCKKFNGTNWDLVGTTLNADTSKAAYVPRLAFGANVPYVSWNEANALGRTQVYVKFFNGSDWESLGTSLNNNPAKSTENPSLALLGSTPYVTFAEYGTSVAQVIVKRYNGSTWEGVGNSLNADLAQAANYADIAFVASTPYVAFSQSQGGRALIYVKYFNGTDWQQVGSGSLNATGSGSAYFPRIRCLGSTPYVLWREDNGSGTPTQMYVKFYTGTSWQALGNSLNLDPTQYAYMADLDVSSGIPYAVWTEPDSLTYSKHVYMKKYNGSTWEQISGSPNGSETTFPSLALNSNIPYVAYPQWNASSYKLVVWHFDAPPLTPTPTLTIAPTLSLTCTPTLTKSPTPTLSETPVITASTTPVYSQTPTSSITGIPTLTFTPTPTLTHTPTTSVSPTLSHTGTPTATFTHTLTYTSSSTASSTPSMSATFTVSSTAPISPTSAVTTPVPLASTAIAFPNPAKSKVVFQWSRQASGDVVICIYNLAGEKVAGLKASASAAGLLEWDCRGVSSGIYLAQITVNNRSQTLRLAIAR